MATVSDSDARLLKLAREHQQAEGSPTLEPHHIELAKYDLEDADIVREAAINERAITQAAAAGHLPLDPTALAAVSDLLDERPDLAASLASALGFAPAIPDPANDRDLNIAAAGGDTTNEEGSE